MPASGNSTVDMIAQYFIVDPNLVAWSGVNINVLGLHTDPAAALDATVAHPTEGHGTQLWLITSLSSVPSSQFPVNVPD